MPGPPFDPERAEDLRSALGIYLALRGNDPEGAAILAERFRTRPRALMHAFASLLEFAFNGWSLAEGEEPEDLIAASARHFARSVR